ncbi:MAG: methyltransferase domain-containing protein [Bacillota bacterium]
MLGFGTGNGYIAFELARLCKDYFVYGLDIAENVIELNNKKAKDRSLKNIKFELYYGINIPNAFLKIWYRT